MIKSWYTNPESTVRHNDVMSHSIDVELESPKELLKPKEVRQEAVPDVI